MNIKERNAIIRQSQDASRFANFDPDVFKFTMKDWDNLVKPPLLTYVPSHIIDQVRAIVNDVKLMNNPTKKYDLVNKLFDTIGLKPLASGTNRRTFYCTYDPTVVIKIASDRVGKSDNISEFILQKVIKPFCTKMFDVTNDGVVALVERVETMKEKDFKKVYSSDVFDFTFEILRRGYIMEDIGGNFYKNWGIRFGFGPVILDYPYIFELDWAKLRCSHKDVHTGIICDGYLDYDYDKGMSEIICTKCGTRYTAKYLARKITAKTLLERINRKRDNEMALFDANLKVVVKCGDKIVRRCYNETDTVVDNSNKLGARKAEYPDAKLKFPKMESPRFTVKRKVEDTDNHQEGHSHGNKKMYPNFTDQPMTTDNLIFYPKNLKNDIIFFLKKMEDKYGAEDAVRLAAIIGTVYKPLDPDFNLEDYTKEEEVETEESPKHEEQPEGKVLTKDDYRFDNDEIKIETKEPTPIEKDVEEVIKTIKENEGKDLEPEEKLSFPKVPKSYEEVKSMSIEDIITESISKDELDLFRENNAPKENLFPVKAISKEEEEAAKLSSNTENVISGIVGSSLVDTMKERHMAEELKKKVLDTFNDKFIPDVDIDSSIRRLVNEITDLIKDAIKASSGTTDGLEVNVAKSVDNRNNECFDVNVKNFTSPVFECSIYPAAAESKEDKIENEGGEKAMEKAIFNFLNAKVDEIEHDYSSEEEAKTSIATALYGAFKDEFKDKFTPARMMDICKEYVDNYVSFNNESEESNEETHTAADEL